MREIFERARKSSAVSENFGNDSKTVFEEIFTIFGKFSDGKFKTVFEEFLQGSTGTAEVGGGGGQGGRCPPPIFLKL